MSSKIYIAAKPLPFAGTMHLSLVYDADGSLATTNDQLVLRGGPEGELSTVTGNPITNTINFVRNLFGSISPGDIELEIGFDLDQSLDNLGSGETTTTRHYTELTPPPGKTVDQFWADLLAEANSMKNGAPDADGDDRELTDAAYLPAGANIFGPNAGEPGLNSNSVIASLLAQSGLDIYANLPKQNGTGSLLSPSLFPQFQNLFVAGSDTDTVTIDDVRVRSVTDLGTGDTTIVIDGSQLEGSGNALTNLALRADEETGSADKIELNNVTAAEVSLKRAPNGDLYIFLPGDEIASIALRDQFDGKRFDQLKIDGTWYSLTDTGDFPVDGMVRPDGNGGFIAFGAGTYKPTETWTTTTSVSVAHNNMALFSYDFAAGTVTFANGYERDENIAAGVSLTDPEAETSLEAAVAYLDQLGYTTTEEALSITLLRHQNPAVTDPTGDGYVEQLSESAANYHFNVMGETMTGPSLVTISTGGGPVQVTPTTIFLHAGDISQSTISNVDVLVTGGDLSLKADQLDDFTEITAGSNELTARAVGEGTFTFGTAPIDIDSTLVHIYSADDGNTKTITGNNQDGQYIHASLFGEDTLQAGDGEGVVLIAGQGENHLIGNSTGGVGFSAVNDTTFYEGFRSAGLAAGSTVDGNGSADNYLVAEGDITGATITDVDILAASNNITITAEQFGSFTTIQASARQVSSGGVAADIAVGAEGAILYAANDGVYDWSTQSDAFFSAAYALSSEGEGTTLIGNGLAFGGETLYASASGNDALTEKGNSSTLDASQSTGDVTLTVDGGDYNTIYTGLGENTVSIIDGDENTIVVNSDLAAGSSITTDNSTNSQLMANADISAATISGIDQLGSETAVTLTATQLAGFGTIGNWDSPSADVTIIAASAGTYSLASKTIIGTATLVGTSGADTLTGSSEDDILFGDAGADTISGGAGADILLGGDGNDAISDGDGADVISGDADNDTITISGTVTSGLTIDGGDGTDTLALGTSSLAIASAELANLEALYFGTGIAAVTLTPEQLDLFAAITHADGSNASLTINADAAGTYSLAGKTITGKATLNGSSGNDTLTGSSNDDTIRGFAGVDTIDGGAGNDNIVIGSGEVPSGETIDGGDGTDKLTVANSGMTPLATLSNMEVLYLNSGVTAINLTAAQLDDFSTITHQSGGSTAFSITAQAAGTYSLAGKTITGAATLNGSSGNDTLTGSSNDDILRGFAGADTINGGDGNDTIQIFSGEVSSGEAIDGGNGTDKLVVGNNSMNPSAMTVTNMEELYLNSGVTAITLSASQLADFETITQATSAGFTITAASAGTYSLSGKTLTGTATLSGSSGADTLTGSSNADTINGNSGNDLIEGGAGNDTLNGGNDTDTLTYASAGSAVTVDLSNGSAQNTGGAGTDTISNFENLTGSAYNDTLTGTSSANIILGGDGNDGITGGGGADTIDGGVGANTLTGGTGNDTYLLARTYGASDIFENDSTGGNSDTLQFGEDIAPDQLWFTQSGNDLVVEVIGTGAKMTIQDWYSGSDYHVEQFVTDEEDVLDHSDVQNLVSAMSGLSVPETTTLSEGYHTALDSTIAANWA